MKTKEIIEYLQGFDPESETAVVAINLKDRTKHEIEGVNFITDSESPAVFVLLGEVADIDTENEASKEEKA